MYGPNACLLQGLDFLAVALCEGDQAIAIAELRVRQETGDGHEGEQRVVLEVARGLGLLPLEHQDLGSLQAECRGLASLLLACCCAVGSSEA